MNDIIRKILLDTSSYEKEDKKRIMEKAINDRLDKSFMEYYKELSNSFRYLNSKNATSVLKKLNKMRDDN